jgi:hypothetical protein
MKIAKTRAFCGLAELVNMTVFSIRLHVSFGIQQALFGVVAKAVSQSLREA